MGCGGWGGLGVRFLSLSEDRSKKEVKMIYTCKCGVESRPERPVRFKSPTKCLGCWLVEEKERLEMQQRFAVLLAQLPREESERIRNALNGRLYGKP
jgi:hypothetical protein